MADEHGGRACDERLSEQQAELEVDLGRLLAHGRAHPERWAGHWFEGPRLVVATTDPARHEAGLRALVDHPDRLDVVRRERTERELQAVRDAVRAVLAEHPDSWWSSGSSVVSGTVSVALSGTGLPVAEQLWAACGDVLDVTVSGRRSPFPAVPEPVERPPGPQAAAPWPRGLVASLELDPTSLRSG